MVMGSLFFLGYPGPLGGANTEALHTLSLWRDHGLMPTMIPTWGPGKPAMRQKLDALGYRTVNMFEEAPSGITSIEGLAGSTVISFCNVHAMEVYPQLREMGCRFIWVPCMGFWFPYEVEAFKRAGVPDAIVYQSEFQQQKLEDAIPEVRGRGHLIRGAFSVAEWPFAPVARQTSGPFVLGKVARDDPTKWSPRLWQIYERVQHPRRTALVMGMSAKIADNLGTTPEWAVWLKPSAMTAQEYYQRIHCLLLVNGGATENWPRVGLEGFATGTPVVAQRAWGWQEQIIHGETGFLGESDEELAHWAAVLAWDEPLRQRIVHQARERLVMELANPTKLWPRWERLFKTVGLFGEVAA